MTDQEITMPEQTHILIEPDHHPKAELIGLVRQMWERVQRDYPEWGLTDLPKTFDPVRNIKHAWRLVEAIRRCTCCFKLDSDHDFVWDVEWALAEWHNARRGKEHQVKRIKWSYDEVGKAIANAFLEIYQEYMDDLDQYRLSQK